MKIFSNRKTTWATIGVLASVVITAGVLILVVGGRQATNPGAQPPAPSSTSSPAAELTTTKATAAPNELLAGTTEAELNADFAAPAIAAARQFLTKVVGMDQPAEGPVRWIGNGLAEVTFYARSPSGQPVPSLATIVTVQRGASRWSVIGTSASQILVDTPAKGQTISSPVPVSGRAHVFEGTVTVRVLYDRNGTPTEIGSGFVTGGGDQLAPFSGQITFNQPDGGSGWILFTELSAANGDVILATSVQVGYAGKAAPPAVNDVHWDPTLPVQDGWLQLPAGAGTVTFTVQTSATDQLEFYLTPTGTETAPLAKLLGTGTKSGDAFTFAWNYPDESLLAHLELVAIGPGGRTELSPFNVYHE
jgi:Immunoglobulin-like domain of bacterial spore germination